MHKPLIAAIAAAFALVSATSFGAAAAAKADKPAAAKAAPTEETPQRPELDSLNFFVGNWTCAGHANTSPFGPAHDTTAKVHAVRAVGDLWIHITYDENKSAANPMPVHAGVYMGYDAALKKFVQGCVDGFGGYCTQSSPGWNGDTIVFDGTANGSGKEEKVRDTFTKKGANELTHTGEMAGAQLDQETCKRGK